MDKSVYRIACLPDSYPDELLYSLLARFKERLDVSSNKYFSDLCFGSRNVIATIEFPTHLDYFTRLLPEGTLFTTEKLIQQHTLFPYFAPFLSKPRYQQLWHDMATNNGPGTHMRSGLMASTISHPRFLRYCRNCVEDDRNNLGECYWHRAHQLPGVIVCPIHKTHLATSKVSPRVNTRQGYFPAEEAVKELDLPLEKLNFSSTILSKLASDSLELLNIPLSDFAQRDLRATYRYILFQMGFCNYAGKIVSTKKLAREFEKYFGIDILKELRCAINPASDNWLYRLIREDASTQHPLRHLLLMQFCGYSPLELFALEIPKPFGDFPWPCLNHACDHYLSPIVTDIKIVRSKYTNGKPIGQFTCECGFSYRRTGPDRSPEDRLQYDKPISLGSIWNFKLSELWANPSMSLRSIARELGVDPLTVKRKAKELSLCFPRYSTRKCKAPPQKQKITRQKKTNSLLDHRQAWLALRARYPNKGVEALRQVNPSVYAWLYRNDRQWLDNNKPPKKPAVSKKSYRVDWERRDDTISKLIPAAVHDLMSTTGKPIRITIASIGRKIGNLGIIQQHLNKLPKTEIILKENVEDADQFAIRKIIWAVEVLKQKNSKPKRWQIIRLAGLDRAKTNPIVAGFLDQIELQSTLGIDLS